MRNVGWLIVAAMMMGGTGVAAGYDYTYEAGAYREAQAVYRLHARRYDRALKEAAKEREQALEEMRRSPEHIEAQKRVDEAYAAYTQARADAINSLRGRSIEYRNLLEQRQHTESRLQLARGNRDTSFKQFQALHEERAEIGRLLRALEEEALRSAGLDELREVWQEASRELNRIRAEQLVAARDAEKAREAMARAYAERDRKEETLVAIARTRAEYRAARDNARREYDLARRAAYWQRTHPPYVRSYDDYYDDFRHHRRSFRSFIRR
jgi:hypothetical protein